MKEIREVDLERVKGGFGPFMAIPTLLFAVYVGIWTAEHNDGDAPESILEW